MSERRGNGPSEGQTAIRRLLGLGLGLVLVMVIGAAALLTTISRALDDLQAHDDRAVVQNTLDRSLRRTILDLTGVTIWDQAYRAARPGGDFEWLDNEAGSYLANNRGQDWTVALDGQNRPFYAWVGDRRAEPHGQGAVLAASAPLIARVRALEIARGGRTPQASQNDPNLADTTSGLIVANGVHYLVAVSTVVPEAADRPRRPGPGSVVVTGQRLDGRLMAILRDLRLRNPHIDAKAAVGRDSVALHDVDGRVIGEVTWTSERPGVEVLRDMTPALVAGFVVIATLSGLLGWLIVRVARRLDQHQRAHDATLRDLEEARDRAEAANVAKSQFLANMSHEIRTPLNGVLGMAQVLARSPLAPGDREKVGMIRTSGEALLSILNDLLDLSKIEAGRMELDVYDFDLETLVRDATRTFAALAEQKDVAFHVEVAEGARGVWRGDGGKIRQVLANLASNAVKFTSQGEVRVVMRRTDEGVACTVADSGAGIARDLLDKLFQRFSQIDPSTTRKFGGTGLGLAISRELIQFLGGEVSVTSVEGRGSAFTFDLPLVWVSPAAADAADEHAEPELPPLRILAAEDNRTNQVLLAALLEPLDVRLRLTADGAEAVEAFRAEPFDLVLMDVQMPVMNGIDAVKAIRDLEFERGTAHTPILALSANVMRHQIEEYLAAGMDGFVAKPIEMAALVAAIEAALAGHAGEESAAA